MDGIAGYILLVFVLPVVVAAVAAAPFLVGPLRKKRWFVESGAASAVALAFATSFAVEPGWKAIARQVVEIPGDDAVYERWHRLGLAACVLVAVAWVLCLLRALSEFPRAMMHTLEVAALAAVAACAFVIFPGSGGALQVVLGVAVFAASFCWILAGTAAYWTAWVAFGAIAVLAMIGGFASLATAAGATSIACLVVAAIGAFGGRGHDAVRQLAGGATLVVLGSLTVLCAACGMAYDYADQPWPLWASVCLIPVGGLLFDGLARRTERPAARTLWNWLGSALVGLAIVATAIALDLSRSSGGDDGGGSDPYADMYGG